ncbi:MAG: hypothetical protein V4677_05900 [Bacteroidota bacterium]
MKNKPSAYIKVFIAAIITLSLISCTENYNVKIKGNGQADVSYELYYLNKDSIKQSYSTEKELKEAKDSLTKQYAQFFKNKLITNYRCSINNDLEVKISYTIKNVDSLGQLLCPMASPSHPIIFNYTSNKLIIDAGQGDSKAEDDIGGWTNGITFKLNVELPKKIIHVNNESAISSDYSENKFSITSSLGELNYSNKRNRITIDY